MDVAFDDPAAIAALRSRDEARVEELVAAWTPGMLRLARAHTVSAATAEDAVQDAWITVLTRIGRFEGRSTLRTWVLGIVINTARRAEAREHRSLPFSSVGWNASEDEWEPVVDPRRFHPQTGHWVSSPLRWDLQPEDQLDAAELQTVIDAALTALPPRQRAVMTARDILGLSGEEVGGLYLLGDGNQRVLLHRGRSKVRAAVERYAATGTDGPEQTDAAPTSGRPSGRVVHRSRTQPSSREPLVCRQLVEVVTDYLEGALDTGLRDRVEEHLATCNHCNGYVSQVRRILDLTAELDPTAPPHLVARLAAALGNATGQDTARRERRNTIRW